MKLHPWSFLLGLASVGMIVAFRRHVRPVAVEVAAFAGHLGRVVWAIVERRAEDIGDLRAEIAERMRQRARDASSVRAPAEPRAAASNNGVSERRPRT